MRDESEIQERLEQLRVAHSEAITNDLSQESIKIAEHKVRQLEWVLDELGGR